MARSHVFLESTTYVINAKSLYTSKEAERINFHILPREERDIITLLEID